MRSVQITSLLATALLGPAYVLADYTGGDNMVCHESPTDSKPGRQEINLGDVTSDLVGHCNDQVHGGSIPYAPANLTFTITSDPAFQDLLIANWTPCNNIVSCADVFQGDLSNLFNTCTGMRKGQIFGGGQIKHWEAANRAKTTGKSCGQLDVSRVYQTPV